MKASSDATADSQNSGSAKPRRRRAVWLLLRLAITVAAFCYLFSIVDVGEMAAAFTRISPGAGIAVLSLTYCFILLGALRWRAVLLAYGACRAPSALQLARLHLVGLFYNTFLPGAVGGDVVRGIATRDAFGKGGTTSSLAVVLVERASGLAGVLIVATTAFILRPLPGVGGVKLWGPIGLLATVGSVWVLALGRKAARFLPAPLARIAFSLPELRSMRPFLLVMAISIGIWVLMALAGHLLVSSVDPGVKLGDSMVVVPLAIAAVYFPLTVAGLGVREAAFVVLYRAVGVAEAAALAGSLALFLCQVIVASSGGLLNILTPLRADTTGTGTRNGD